MTKTIKARPTVYKGIQMRSRLEAGFAAWLDANNFEWEYEPCAFATDAGQYLPDFRLRDVFVTWSPDPVTVYIEVKPDSWASASFDCGCPYVALSGHAVPNHSPECRNAAADGLDEQLRMCARAEIIMASEPDAWLILMRPTAGYSVYFKYLNGDPRSFCDPAAVSLIEVDRGDTVKVGFHLAGATPVGPWADKYWQAKP